MPPKADFLGVYSTGHNIPWVRMQAREEKFASTITFLLYFVSFHMHINSKNDRSIVLNIKRCFSCFIYGFIEKRRWMSNMYNHSETNFCLDYVFILSNSNFLTKYKWTGYRQLYPCICSIIGLKFKSCWIRILRRFDNVPWFNIHK